MKNLVHFIRPCILTMSLLCSLPASSVEPWVLDQFSAWQAKGLTPDHICAQLTDMGVEDNSIQEALAAYNERFSAASSTDDTSNDAALARLLANEEEASYRSRVSISAASSANDTSNDAALAHLLTAAEEEQRRCSNRAAEEAASAAYIAQLQEEEERRAANDAATAERDLRLDIYNSLPIPPWTRNDGDVHTYNEAFVRPVFPHLQTFDETHIIRLCPRQDKTVEDTITEIRTYARTPEEDQRFPGYNVALQKLASQPQGAIESETDTNVHNVFRRIWELACFIDTYVAQHPHTTEICYAVMRAGSEIATQLLSARDYVLYSLDENAATGGGCWPGIAGRMVSLYNAFLGNIARIYK